MENVSNFYKPPRLMQYYFSNRICDGEEVEITLQTWQEVLDEKMEEVYLED